MKERRKLFSDNVPPMTTKRRKLFSCDEEHEHNHNEEEVVFLCSDCGHKLSKEEIDLGICKCCGSTRENVLNRRSLFEDDFQKEFSNTSDPLELKLKEFSGREISKDLFEKEFSEAERTELKERNYSEELEDGGIKISGTAFLESRLFSKLVVSVTKEYDLIPDIMNGGDKERYINSLDMSPKCIAILKKVHGVNEGDQEGWMEDSGILSDLPAEFGGRAINVPEFKEIIEERYPDAPEDIMEKLKARGIIEDKDDKIEIK